MWKLFAGIVFSLFPRRWRAKMPRADEIPWEAATAVSGIVESVIGLGALLVWYSVSVTTWATQAIDSAVNGGKTIDVGETVGFAALVLWVFHPLTWLISYLVVEGALRLLGAAFTGDIMGTMPFYATDWCYGLLTHRPKESGGPQAPSFKAQARSFAEAMRDRWDTHRLPKVADELQRSARDGEEFLEIRACRPKTEWVPPRVIRVEDTYYRLEEKLREKSARPFVYRLRKLPAGVPGRTVIFYQIELPPPEMGQLSA